MAEEFDFDEDFDDVIEAEEEEITKVKKPSKKQVIEEDDIEEEIEEPVARPARVPPIAPAPKRAAAPVNATRQPTQTAKIEERYSAYNISPKIGILDNITKQPVMETQDPTTLIVSMLCEVMNQLNDIKQSL